MDQDKSQEKAKDRANDSSNEYSGYTGRAARVRNLDEEAWKTRVYENDLARMTRKHTWIGEEDDAEKLKNADAANAAGGMRETRIFEGSQTDARYTRQYVRPEIEPPLSEQRSESEQSGDRKKTADNPIKKLRSMRRIRIGDRKRFKRLIAVLAVIALIIICEAGFFIMDARVSKLPDEIRNVNKQTEDVRSDNKKLAKSNKELGDRESKEEQKASWERLRDKVKEAVGETSS